MTVSNPFKMAAGAPSLQFVRPWCSQRTLAQCDQWLAVDKPACVAQGNSTEDSLSSRLAAAGLGQWAEGLLPRGVSGACWLSSGLGTASREGRLIGAEREIAVAIHAFRGRSSGRVGEHSFRLRARGPAGAILCFTTRALPMALVAEIDKAGYRVAGLSGRHEASIGTRPLVHVSTVRAAGRPTVAAPLPSEFDAWLSAAPTRSPAQFEAAVVEAGIARFAVARRRDVYRVLAEASGEISGLTVDSYGGYCVVATSSEEASTVAPRLAEFLMDQGATGVYVKHRARKDLRQLPPEALAPPGPLAGEAAPNPLPLSLGPVRMNFRLGDGHSTGVFLDQAANWPRMAELAGGGAVLNLFCYTGAFTVFAAAAGVASTVSVDLSGRALTRLSENLSLNGLSGNQHQLLKADALKWVARAGRRSQRFEVVVLDPPSFGTRSRGVLSLRRDYEQLVEQSLRLLSAGGRLLSVVHHRGLDHELIVDTIHRVAAKQGRRVGVSTLAGDWDCPTLAGVSQTKNVLCTSLGT